MRLPRLKLFKFLRLLKPKDWSQRVSFWPTEYPHHITTWADVAAMQHIITVAGGIGNSIAIDRLLKDENFWRELSRFFQNKADELGGIEAIYSLARPSIAVRRVPLFCWDSEEKLEPSDFTSTEETSV